MKGNSYNNCEILKYCVTLVFLILAGCSDMSQRNPTPTLLIETDVSPNIVLPDTVPELIPLLSESPLYRISAARKLGEIGPDASSAVPALVISLYYDDNYEVRLAAALALGEIGSEAKRAVPVLTAALLTDFVQVRRAAAIALGKIGDTAAIYSLVRALDDNDVFVSGEAARSIGILAGQDLPGIGSTDFLLAENGLPIIVNAAKEWWNREGKYKDWICTQP